MESLDAYLQGLIQDKGPISIAHYMEICLTHPQFGYYVTKDPLGPAGDFITAPEISQMFGEIIGIWITDCWYKMGRPSLLQLVELGPGRGTLMADILRTLKIEPDLEKAAQVHFIEASPVLAAKQADLVGARWHSDLSPVPAGPSILIANEFFDALPVHQFQKTEAGWLEVCVGVKDFCLVGVLNAPGEVLDRVPEQLRNSASTGEMVEISPQSLDICAAIGSRIKTDGAIALIIDYGYDEDACGETLQAVRQHRYAKIFENPGLADLTGHVNFAALKRVLSAAGAEVWGPTGQGGFLDRLGIAERADRLSKSASSKQKQDIVSALHRLTSAKGMGQLFRVMAGGPPGQDQPLGFELDSND